MRRVTSGKLGPNEARVQGGGEATMKRVTTKEGGMQGYHTPNSGAPSPSLPSPGMPTPGRKFKNMSDTKRIMTLRECSSIIDGLKVIYFNKVRAQPSLSSFLLLFSSFFSSSFLVRGY